MFKSVILICISFTLMGKDISYTKDILPPNHTAIQDGIQIINIAHNLNEILVPKSDLCPACTDEKIIKTANKEITFLPGCEYLALEDRINTTHKIGLLTCYESIQNLMFQDDEKKHNRLDILKNLFKELHPLEQEFIALTLTAHGEAGGLAPPNEELLSIMMTLQNRKETARKWAKKDYLKGLEKWPQESKHRKQLEAELKQLTDELIAGPILSKDSYSKTVRIKEITKELEKPWNQINALDIALDYKQFSMYNKRKDGNVKKELWYRILDRPLSHRMVEDSIDAFIMFKQAKYTPLDSYKKITHYHTNYVDPDWSDASKLVDLKINDVKIDGKYLETRKEHVRHYFFKDIRWKYQGHPYREEYK